MDVNSSNAGSTEPAPREFARGGLRIGPRPAGESLAFDDPHCSYRIPWRVDRIGYRPGLLAALNAAPPVAALERCHQDRSWSDARGRTWDWSDRNGWVVDGWATFGGHDPDDHGPFSERAA